MNIPLREYWDLLVVHLKPQKARFALLTLLLFSSIGLQVFIPQITRYFIDTATSSQSAAALIPAALAFMGLALMQQVTAVSARYVGENVAWTATNALRAELAAHCLRLDMSYHNNTSPGELIERIDGDVAELSNFFSQLVIRVLGNLILLVGILGALLLENVGVGLAFTVYATITLIALNRVRGIAIPHDKALRQANADLFGFLEERLSGTEDIRSSGAVDFVLQGLYRLQYEILLLWRKSWSMHFVVRLVAGLLITAGFAMTIVLSYSLYTTGVITLGAAYLIFHYMNSIARPIREITQQVENLQNIGAAVERLKELRSVQPSIVDGAGTPVADGSLGLTFEDVSFQYHDDELVLDGLSFELKPGAVLGLLGRTGSGKTTLTRLIFRLYDPTGGRVVLGNTDVRNTRLGVLRQRVAMVTQDVQLFQATIRDNLTFFDGTIPDEQILAVIEELELGDWYARLPEGLDTRLETGGRSLSAGEAQLLAFARVFLRDPGLVILDEASSRLDPATEQRIERAIDKLLEGRTGIIVAHRLGTVQRAHEIMILEDGRVTEHGDRKRLSADPTSRFYNLLQTGLEEAFA